MELRRVTSAFVSDIVIEGWTSLIWTERYLAAGDFQLKTADIVGTMTKLPLDSFVTHAETNEVMVVEDYQIEEDAEGIDYLTVSGRSFETVFERRISANNSGNPIVITDTAANIAAFLMDPLGAFANNNLMQYTGGTFYGDKIQNIWLSVKAGTNTGAVSTQQIIPLDYVYNNVQKILGQDGLGIRVDRTDRSGGGMKIEIYRGVDKRVGHGILYNTVTIDAVRGDVSKGTYVISKKGLKNVSYPMRTSATNSQNFLELDNVSNRDRLGFNNDNILPAGLARRDLLLDATDIDASKVNQNLGSLLLARNAAALKATEAFTVASVTATPTIPYKYKQHYDLGDQVSFTGLYGIKADLTVTEYVRTHDDTGDVGHPTFSGGSQ